MKRSGRRASAGKPKTMKMKTLKPGEPKNVAKTMGRSL